MIPETDINLTVLEEQIQPSKTYKLDLTRKKVTSMIDNQEAIIQAVQKILYTERYACVIYSSQYGVELDDLIGQEYDLIKADIKRVISEALLVDNRIVSIKNFDIQQVGLDKLEVSFIVVSTEGEVNFNTEVLII